MGAALGLYAVIISGQWWLLAVGAMAIVAAWTYTASPRPYGYAGWGELSVLFFFGPVAVLGTMLLQAGLVTWWAVLSSFAVGLWAVALLMINNIRDIDGDALAGKRTLAVQLGGPRARNVFALTLITTQLLEIVVSFAHPWVLLTLVTAAPTVFFAAAMRLGPQGLALRPIFGGVSLVGLVYGLLFALGLAL